MSTYVSQLMQQTGIHLPTHSNSGNGNNLAAIFNTESSAQAMPIPEEHYEVVVPQPMQPAIQPIAPIVQRQPVTTVSDRPNHQEIPAPSLDLTHLSPIPIPSQEIVDRNSITISEATSNTALPETSELTVIEQIQNQPTHTSLSVPIQKQPRPVEGVPPRSSTLAPPPLDVTETLPQPIPELGADDSLSPQTYLQIVRDWVTSPPTIREDVRDVILEQPNQVPQTVPSKLAARSQHAASPIEITQSTERSATPVQQDFVLSIGSIHLTIASPPPEIPPPPIATPPAITTPEAEPFRLSRHYLRFR